MPRDETAPDVERDAFAEKLFRSVLGYFDIFSIHLGARLGLYRALAEAGPMTSAGARRACGHRRTVRARVARAAGDGRDPCGRDPRGRCEPVPVACRPRRGAPGRRLALVHGRERDPADVAARRLRPGGGGVPDRGRRAVRRVRRRRRGRARGREPAHVADDVAERVAPRRSPRSTPGSPRTRRRGSWMWDAGRDGPRSRWRRRIRPSPSTGSIPIRPRWSWPAATRRPRASRTASASTRRTPAHSPPTARWPSRRRSNASTTWPGRSRCCGRSVPRSTTRARCSWWTNGRRRRSRVSPMSSRPTSTAGACSTAFRPGCSSSRRRERERRCAPSTLKRYASEAGFAGFEVLPIEHDTFRLYLLRASS